MKSKRVGPLSEKPAKATGNKRPGTSSTIAKGALTKEKTEMRERSPKNAKAGGLLTIDLSKVVMQIEGVKITPVKPGPVNANGSLLRITMIVPLAAASVPVGTGG
jgi:hypothetical protein